jgi:hypothetical protein
MLGAREAELKRVGSIGGMPQFEFVCPHCGQKVSFSDPMIDSLVVAVKVDPCQRAPGHRWMAVRISPETGDGR